jgi:transposase-like protein
MAAVARELDLVPTALREWVAGARANRSGGKTGLTTAEREELSRLRKQVRVLEEEREMLKKGNGLLREAPAMRFAFIAAEKAEHSVTILCRCLRVTRSGFYAWARRGPSARAQRGLVLRTKLRAFTRPRATATGAPACGRTCGRTAKRSAKSACGG